MTIGVCIAVAVGDLAPYGVMLTQFLLIFWILIVIEIFIVAALSLKPGQSYINTMTHAFQWVIVVVMLLFIYWGIRVQRAR